MKKVFITSILTINILVFSSCSISSQSVQFEKFLESFNIVSMEGIGDFRSLVNNGKNMTKEQALMFVYEKDTSKLYCHFQEFNMETEERGAMVTDLYLPQKCLKIETPNFILIGYSTFECQDPNELLEMFLTLKIIDSKTLQTTDSLVVYRGNEYDWYMTGLVSSENNKIFTIEQLGEREFNAKAAIYKINKSLKFEIEKQKDDIKEWLDDHEKGIEILGWNEVFIN